MNDGDVIKQFSEGVEKEEQELIQQLQTLEPILPGNHKQERNNKNGPTEYPKFDGQNVIYLGPGGTSYTYVKIYDDEPKTKAQENRRKKIHELRKP